MKNKGGDLNTQSVDSKNTKNDISVKKEKETAIADYLLKLITERYAELHKMSLAFHETHAKKAKANATSKKPANHIQSMSNPQAGLCCPWKR